MQNALHLLVPVAVVSVGVILLFGLLNMARGGSTNRSQTLMRWRVGIQFAAIVIIMAAIYFSR